MVGIAAVRRGIVQLAAVGVFWGLSAIQACPQHRPPLLVPLGQFFRDLSERIDPGGGVQSNYECAVAVYKACLAAKPQAACEGESHCGDGRRCCCGGRILIVQSNQHLYRSLKIGERPVTCARRQSW